MKMIHPPCQSNRAQLMARLHRCFPEHVRDVDPDAPIASLVLDSLDWVDFLCALDAEFHVSLSIAEFKALGTVGDLGALIESKIKLN